jgi:hypothetical protein
MSNFIVDGAKQQEIEKIKRSIDDLMRTDPHAADVTPNGVQSPELQKLLDRIYEIVGKPGPSPFDYMAEAFADRVLDGGPYTEDVVRQRIENEVLMLLDTVGPTRIKLFTNLTKQSQ